MNTRLLFGLLWLTPTLCFGALSTTTSYFLNVEALTNVTARSAVRGLTGVFTNSVSAAGFNTSGTTNATLTGNLLANGATLTNGITSGASTFTGAVGFANGTGALPSISFASDTSLGFYRFASGQIGIGSGGGIVTRISSAALTMKDNFALGWSTDPGTVAADVNLVRDGAANTLALRNGVNAQTFNIYNTFTDASNYERLALIWAGNSFFIQAQNAGTGTQRGIVLDGSSLTLRSAGTARWLVSSSGHFLANADNTYDIGASGATRPRSIYVGTDGTFGGFVSAGGNISAGSGSAIRWATRTQMASSADGIVRLINNAANDFDRLQFGGTTASFPALKRSTTNIVVRLADDTTDTGLTADAINLSKTITAGGTTGNQTINKSSGSVNFAAAGQSITVTSDHCTANSIIMATVGTDDTTAKSCIAVPGAGSFVLKLNAAATAETKVMFLITN